MTKSNPPSTGGSDRLLVDALLKGDREAGEQLLANNYQMVFRSLVKLCGDAELASDLTQDTFQRAWSSLRSYRGEAAFSSWLYRIAYTTFLNHIRRPHLVQPVDDLEAHTSPIDPETTHQGVLQQLSRSESEQRLRSAVVALPDRQRMAITAKFWGELSTTEIAALEDVSAVAIRKRIRKAIAALASVLETEHSTLTTLTCAGGSAT